MPMSPWGQKHHHGLKRGESAFTQSTDMVGGQRNERFVPEPTFVAVAQLSRQQARRTCIDRRESLRIGPMMMTLSTASHIASER